MLEETGKVVDNKSKRELELQEKLLSSDKMCGTLKTDMKVLKIKLEKSEYEVTRLQKANKTLAKIEKTNEDSKKLFAEWEKNNSGHTEKIKIQDKTLAKQ